MIYINFISCYKRKDSRYGRIENLENLEKTEKKKEGSFD